MFTNDSDNPDFDDAAMDRMFQALGHTVRRRILDLLRTTPGQNVGQLAQNFDVSRIAIMNHLTVLEAAGLVISERQGRERKLYMNAAPIEMITQRWTDAFSQHWAGRMVAIKEIAEKSAQKGRDD